MSPSSTRPTELERRYTRWMTLFYPAADRRERGSELVDTYLSLAAPDRRRPSIADIADLAAGGLRRHVRAAPGLGPGFRLAGLLALMTATAFAAGLMVLEVLDPGRPAGAPPTPALSLGMAVWAAWLLAAVAHVAAPVRWFRRAAGLAVLVTAGTVPAAPLTGLLRPPLSVLLPQLVLGLVALGAAGRHPWRVRLLIPLTAAAVSVPVALTTAPTADASFYGYYRAAAQVMPATAVTLLIGATLLALAGATRGDHRAAWALLILLTPIGMLALNPLGALFDDNTYGRPIIPTWSSMVVATALVVVIGPALLPLALAARARLSPSGRTPVAGDSHCPACGAPHQPGRPLT